MDLTTAAGRLARVDAELERYPHVDQLLGVQLRQRAQQPDALLNRLVFSLCAGAGAANHWEWLLDGANLPAFQAHFQDRLPRRLTDPDGWDLGLASMLAELEAITTFATCDHVSDVRLSRERQERAADFTALVGSKPAIVEVKRADGLAGELWLAHALLDAWQLHYSALAKLGINLWASEAYHSPRLTRGVSEVERKALRQQLRTLFTDQASHRLVARLHGPEPVPIIEGIFYAQRKDQGSGVSVRPFWTGPDTRTPGAVRSADTDLANSMGSLRGLADVVFQVRTALPQLFHSAKKSEGNPLLIPYVVYDGNELDGVDLRPLAAMLGEVLQWDRRVHVIVNPPGRTERVCFYWDPGGAAAACDKFEEWAQRVSD